MTENPIALLLTAIQAAKALAISQRTLCGLTKSGQIRALWLEIQAAIADGQSLASIRQWLEEEGGIVVTVQSLGSYLTRIRRKEIAKASAPTPPAQPSAETKLPPVPNPPAKLQESTKKKRGFEYPPGPPDESKLIWLVRSEKDSLHPRVGNRRRQNFLPARPNGGQYAPVRRPRNKARHGPWRPPEPSAR